jgi:large subunit ribosomal protein L25
MSENLNVERRTVFGKNAMRRLRAAGRVPAVLYGEKLEALSLSVDAKQMETLRSRMGSNAIFDLSLDGTDQRRAVMLKEIQRHPIQRTISHCDFIRISLDKAVTVRVPLALEGQSIGVKDFGGNLELIQREVTVECMPNAIPESIIVDVTELGVGDAVHISDLALPKGVTPLDDASTTLLHVVPPTVEKEVGVGEDEEAPEATAEAEPAPEEKPSS